MYSTSQRHKDKSKIILFISNDGKENAKEVLACKCDHIVRDMLVSWSLARILLQTCLLLGAISNKT